MINNLADRFRMTLWSAKWLLMSLAGPENYFLANIIFARSKQADITLLFQCQDQHRHLTNVGKYLIENQNVLQSCPNSFRQIDGRLL